MKYVILGELDQETTDDVASPLQFDVAERITHPKYIRRTSRNDIALLKLNQTVKFNSYISPACLWDSNKIPATEAIATGWGVNADGYKYSHLQEMYLDIINHTLCKDQLSKLWALGPKGDIQDDSQLCAGSLTDSIDTCDVSSDLIKSILS